MPGTEGCDTWKEAEAALYQAADVVPFANSVVPMFGKDAEFEMIGRSSPTSIRMLASSAAATPLHGDREKEHAT